VLTTEDLIVGDEPNRFQSFNISYDRPSDREVLGRALVVQPYGEKPRMSYQAGYTNLRRAAAWEKIALFETSLGRLRTFWFVEPERTHKSAEDGGVGDQVWLSQEPDPFWDYVGIVLRDGRKAVVEVLKAEEYDKKTGTWVLTLADKLPWDFVPNEVCRLGAARMVRFGSDSLEEEWVLPGFAAAVNFEMLEVLIERDLFLE
jgi:hypothetical protein